MSDTSPSVPASFLRVGSAWFAGVVLFAALPTLLQLAAGGLRPRELFSSTSPDGAYRVDGVVRIDLPVSVRELERRWIGCSSGCTKRTIFRNRQWCGNQRAAA
jgi:hypothetical protein